jgi:multiple sugar transport system substrate-binding protein
MRHGYKAVPYQAGYTLFVQKGVMALRKKSLIASLLGAVTVIFLLAGCGNKTADRPLTIMVESGSPGEMAARATAAEFTELTGVEVVINSVPYIGLFDSITTQLRARTATHDVVTLDVLWLPAFRQGLIPLDDLVTQEMINDFLPTMQDGGTLDGTLYGMPMWINCKVLIYRADLFADPGNQAAFKERFGYDLRPPTTWEEYFDVAEFFTTSGMHGTAVYGANSGDTVCTWLDHVAQAGAYPLVLGPNNEVLVDNQAHVDGLQFMIDQMKRGVVPAGALAMASTEVQEMFVNGMLAMQLNWSHQFPAAHAVMPNQVGVTTMIAGEAGVAAITGPWFMSIMRESPNIDVAKKYLLFMFERNEAYMESPLRIAGRRSVYERHGELPGNEHMRAVLDTLSAPQSQNRPATPHWTEIESVLAGAIQNAMSGSASAQESLSAVREQIEQILSR